MNVLSDILHKAGILKDSPENYSSGGYALLVRNSTTGRLENVSSSSVLPDQTGNTGKYLTTDGTTASWVAIGGTLPTGGTAGQILAKIDGTNYNTEWIDNYTTDVREKVKAGEAISKGQAVYISGADGTNPIVSKASNATEATSSKTLGLLLQSLSLNDQGFVITEGRLGGLDTSTASIADPVWLGTDGNLIFGLANKPVAPAHLVYLGVVTRVNSNNGEIFVHVQNGFELQELHNVLINTPTDGQVLKYESATGLWKNGTDSSNNIYNSNGSLTANRTVTMSTRSLTFSGSSTTTVVTASGKLLVGGATESAAYNMRVTGSADISFYLNVGNLIDTVNLYASATTNTFTSIITGFGEFTNQASAPAIPSAGTGRLYSKTDDKIYWRSSSGTEFDLTATGTVTSVALATGTTGTDVNVSGSPITSSGTITLNIPDASATARGLVTTGSQTFAGSKTFDGNIFLSGAWTPNGRGSIIFTSATTGSGLVPTSGQVAISSGFADRFTIYFSGSTKVANFVGSSLTTGQLYTLPNASGTLALTSDVTNIYNSNGTLSSARTVTLGGYSLTFAGSTMSPVITSTGRLMLGGATDLGIYAMAATGSISVSSNVFAGQGVEANYLKATYTNLSLIAAITTPPVGSGYLYAKSTDKKIYFKNSDGTDYDLTLGGTVTGTGTQNYITKWNNAGGTAIGNSLIYDNGTNVLIGSTTSVQGAFQVTQNGGGILVRTDNSNFGFGIINTASSNKAWDIAPFNNHLAFNESNVATHFMLFAGGNTGFGTIADAGYKVDINGTLRAVTGGGSGIVVEQATGAYTRIKLSGSTWVESTNNDTYWYNQFTTWSATSSVLNIADGVLNIGTQSSVNSAILNVVSTTKGFLPPRMTSTQRGSIGTPASGLVVYQSTDNALSVYNGTAWSDILTTSNYDGLNIAFGTTTGTKIGTATSQKLGFWNATPIVQPTTSIAEAAFVENSGGTAVNVDSTFAGYTIQQIAQALKDTGLLA